MSFSFIPKWVCAPIVAISVVSLAGCAAGGGSNGLGAVPATPAQTGFVRFGSSGPVLQTLDVPLRQFPERRRDPSHRNPRQPHHRVRRQQKRLEYWRRLRLTKIAEEIFVSAQAHAQETARKYDEIGTRIGNGARQTARRRPR